LSIADKGTVGLIPVTRIGYMTALDLIRSYKPLC